MEEPFMVEEINHLSFQNSYYQMNYSQKMRITHLETHQTSSQQIKIVTHITPGEIIIINNKSQIPWIDHNNITPNQGHHLQSIDNNITEEEKTYVTVMASI